LRTDAALLQSRARSCKLVGDHLTAADTMMGFSIAFILKMGLGTKGKEWPAVNAWLANVESTPAYKKAVEKTGHTLS
jgi:glutathione S-transferase